MPRPISLLTRQQVLERLTALLVADDDDRVARLEHRVRAGRRDDPVVTLDRDDGDARPVADVGALQRLSDERGALLDVEPLQQRPVGEHRLHLVGLDRLEVRTLQDRSDHPRESIGKLQQLLGIGTLLGLAVQFPFAGVMRDDHDPAPVADRYLVLFAHAGKVALLDVHTHYDQCPRL